MNSALLKSRDRVPAVDTSTPRSESRVLVMVHLDAGL